MSMLHLELYKNDEKGSLSQAGNKIYDYVKPLLYDRRRDLLDPTKFLDDALMY